MNIQTGDRKVNAQALIVGGMLKMGVLMARAVTVLAIMCLAEYGKAHGQSMIYSFSGAGYGWLGTQQFNGPYSITAIANTNQIAPSGVGNGEWVPNLTATVFIPGVGTGTFLDITTMAVTWSNWVAGVFFYDKSSLIGIVDSAFVSYDLSMAVGPITGDLMGGGANLPTTAGYFSLDTPSGTVTFEAVAQSVPEPCALGSVGVGAITLGSWFWRKRRFQRSSRKGTAWSGVKGPEDLILRSDTVLVFRADFC